MEQHRGKEGVPGVGVDVRLHCRFLISFRLDWDLSLPVCCFLLSRLPSFVNIYLHEHLERKVLFLFPSLYTQCLAYSTCLIDIF